MLSYSDTGLVPGSTHTYQIRVFDPFGNKHPSTVSAPVTIAGQTTPNAYLSDVTRDGAADLWRLGEGSGPIGFDS